MTDDANSFIIMGLCWLLTFLSITAHIFQVWDVGSHRGAKPMATTPVALKWLTLASQTLLHSQA